eukprot:Phypoly_transcript_20031.p1 GENE.Phypoly_transcript_20031~~Phypoly_transcript_20031.p1  ORF type:complete len:100 (+),score=5.88 Phypoly_transcript_20031:356-655(+)
MIFFLLNLTLGATGYSDANTAVDRVSAYEVLVAPLLAVGANTHNTIQEYWASLKVILTNKVVAPNPNPFLARAKEAMCYNYYFQLGDANNSGGNCINVI